MPSWTCFRIPPATCRVRLSVSLSRSALTGGNLPAWVVLIAPSLRCMAYSALVLRDPGQWPRTTTECRPFPEPYEALNDARHAPISREPGGRKGAAAGGGEE